MKPLNLDNKPCSPTSSNCIIWQGPDIPCINLCTGDTVSDVVHKLAVELCNILDQLDVNNYDLACLGITACKPKDFQALIQFLIDKICELQGINPDTGKATNGCPDCVVTVAPCFQTGNVTTMQLLDYVQMIAEKVCALIDEIATINAQLTDLNIRVEVLENTPPPTFEIPAFTLGCDIGSLNDGTTQYINVVLEEFINNVWCPFYQATGTTNDLLAAIAAICIQDTDLQLTTNTAFSTNPNWIQSGDYNTVADAINNLWVALCDIYQYASTLSLSVTDTNTVNLTLTSGVLTAAVQDTGWVRLEGFSYIEDDNALLPPQCRRIGNVIYFRGVIVVPLSSGGSVLTWDYQSGVNSYFYNFSVTPFQGTGGVLLSGGAGGFQFNNGNRVIPTSVLPLGYQIDASYQNAAGYKIATRIVPIDYDPGTGDADNSTILTTLFSQSITANGGLSIGLVADLEASGISGTGGLASFNTSHLNYIISHVVSGERVPQFESVTNRVHSKAGAAGATDVSLDYPDGYNYPFTCNGNDETEVGGFFQKLDGLTAFISPCGTTIPTPNPCVG